MKVLDLFCGAGGASMGLHHAFPDAEITGVDINPMPHYPFTFVQGDALDFPLEGYDFIWASPPCQAHSSATFLARHNGIVYEEFIERTRKKLTQAGTPYCIENVERAPLISPVKLCGQMFGLKLLRHRIFETNFPVAQPEHMSHQGLVRGIDFICAVRGACHNAYDSHDASKGRRPHTRETCDCFGDMWKSALEIDWMTKREMSESIPPKYSQYIGEQFPLRP